MNTTALKWIYRSLAVFGSLFVLSVLIIPFMEAPILEQTLQKFNDRSDYQLEVEEGNLTILRSFPRLGLQFEGAEIRVRGKDPFLKAGEIVLYTNLFQLINGSYELQSFYLRDVVVKLRTDKQDHSNFAISSDKSRSSGAVFLKWRDAQIDQLHLSYSDEEENQQYEFQIAAARLDGELDGEHLKIEGRAEGIVERLRLNDDWKWNDLPVQVVGTYEWQKDVHQDFDFRELALGATEWNAAGSVREGENPLYDVRLISEEIQLHHSTPLLPPVWKKSLEGMEYGGRAKTEIHLFGPLQQHTDPEVEVSFSLREGRYSSDQFPGGLTEVKSEGYYHYKNGEEARLRCASLNGLWNESPFGGSLTLDHDNEVSIDARIDRLGCPLSVLEKEVLDSNWSLEEGNLELRNAAVENMEVSSDFSPKWADITGRLTGDDLRGSYGDSNWQIRELVLDWGPDSIDVQQFNGAFLESKFQVEGRIAMPARFPNRWNEFTPRGMVNISADRIAVHHWLRQFGFTRQARWKPVANTSLPSEVWFEKIPDAYLALEAEIGQLSYGDILWREVFLNADMREEAIAFKSDLKTASGSLDLQGNFSVEGSPRLKMNGAMEKIDIRKLFREWNDFGQSLVEAHHLRGEMNARFLLNAKWRPNGTFDYEQFEVISGLQVNDGELVDLELLEDFSSYVDIRDLRHIHFESLKNILVIRDRSVYIPSMFIRSNAANMTINGVHDFDHTLNYNLKLNAGQLLSRRILKKRDNTRAVPTKRNGWFNMHYTIEGHPDHLEYETNRQNVEASFRKCDEIRDKARQRLIEAFGSRHRVPLFVEPTDWESIPEYESSPTSDPAHLEGF